jgi:hypothetical protein
MAGEQPVLHSPVTFAKTDRRDVDESTKMGMGLATAYIIELF